MQDLQGALIGNLTLRLGVRDTYSLFVRNICEGDYPSESAGSALEFDDCISYEDKSAGLRRIAASIPSTFALGPANVSIPLVEAVIDAGLGLALCYRGCKGAPCAARRLCPCDGNVGCCVNLDRDTGTAAVVGADEFACFCTSGVIAAPFCDSDDSAYSHRLFGA
ncbi:hypothetical protein VD0002_g3296 [Verticillium dahliae]|nr:hypothetical protein VD0003_g4894 [Verticillium dahliae]PNH65861.1 hypothetical protein VD0002_g3296 [Verticillium dahliae]